MLAAWRLEAAAATAVINERAEVEAAARIDAADPVLGSAPLTADALVRVWAAEMLHVQLAPIDAIPTAVRTAFMRAQRLLWAGEPILDARMLVDEPPLPEGPTEP